MKTDHELLELAAKAAGLNITWENGQEYAEILTPFRGHLMNYEPWNPLTNDGDALRLAVACGINPIQCPCSIDAMHFDSFVIETEIFEDHAGDKMKATRRAITRAAAAMAENIPS